MGITLHNLKMFLKFKFISINQYLNALKTLIFALDVRLHFFKA